MTQYVAFLRALNVGGNHIVKMADLRQMIAALGYDHVSTYIQSGNVLFDTTAVSDAAIEQEIEQHLETTLGYPVATFVRTREEITAVLQTLPYTPEELANTKLYIAFLKGKPDNHQLEQLSPYQNEIDSFQLGAKEIYWLCQTSASKSKFSGSVLEKVLDCQTTLRGISTITKINAKYFS